MAMAQTAYQARPALRHTSAAAARHIRRTETPLFQAFLRPSPAKVTDGLCIKDSTTIDPACGTGGFLISAFKHITSNNNDMTYEDIAVD